MKSSLEARVYRSFDELSGLQEQWDTLAASAGAEVFLTYDWCRIWWKYYGKDRDLRVWAFQKGTDLVGIVPLFLETVWLGPVSVRAARLLVSDHTLAQFSLPIVGDYLEEVAQGLAEFLLAEKWDILHVGPVAGLYRHRDALMGALQKAFGGACSVSCRQKLVQTYYFVADTWEAQLGSLSKNGRKHVRHSLRELDRVMENQPGELVCDHANCANVDELFRGFVDMHQQLWRKKGRPGHFGDWPDAFDFHQELARTQLEHDRLRLMRLRWGQRVLAYEYAFRFGERYFTFLCARDDGDDLAHLSIGSIMFCKLLQGAIREDIKCIDDMESRYEHKRRLGGQLLPMTDIFIVPRRFMCLARARVFGLLSTLLHLSYCRVWYMRIAPKLPLRRRPLWQSWIRSAAFCRYMQFIAAAGACAAAFLGQAQPMLQDVCRTGIVH